MAVLSEEVTATTINIDDELARLFYLFRLCNLNVRYYGSRAEQFENRTRWLEIGSALSSALALFGLLFPVGPQWKGWQVGGAAILAGISTVLAALTPLTGWSLKSKQCCKLHALYSQLFGQVQSVIVQIRRDGLSSENLGASKQTQEAYRQLHALDEPDPNQKLIDREDQKVREAFPEDYLYSRF